MHNEKRTIDFALRLPALWFVRLYRPKWDEKQRVHHGHHNYLDDQKTLMYSATVDLEEMYLFYYFDSHDKLYTAQYGSQKEHASFGQWKKDYDNFKKSLTAKYGKPDTSTVVNNVDQNLIDAAGSHALEYGYVTYLSEWKKGRTIIQLGLTSQEYQICLSVIYSDKNHKDDPNDSGL